MITEVVLLSLYYPYIVPTQYLHIVCHTVVLSIYNKSNGRCKQHIEQKMSFLKIPLIPPEGAEQYKNREYLKGAIGKEKVYLLCGKKQRTHGTVDKSSGKTNNKA